MNQQKKGYLFIILSAICFATGGILIKINTWSPMTISGVRSLFAIPVLYIFYRRIGHKFRFNKSVFFCAFANTGMCTTFVIANKLTTAANAIVLQFTLPIYILLLTWIFFKKKPDKISVLSALLSFAGICFFFFDSISSTGMIGNIIALVSGFLYAIVFMTKKIPGSDFASSALLSFALNFVIGIPFMLLEKGGKAIIGSIFDDAGLKPDVRFVTWDDYAVMSMVESGMGIGILPSLILKRMPYDIEVRPLDPPVHRHIGVITRHGARLSKLSETFLEYVKESIGTG